MITILQMAKTYKTIAPFLNSAENKTSKLFSYAGLCIGVFLLLTSVQLYIDINQLLKDKNPSKNGYDFLSVTKTITNQNMGKDNRFTKADIEDLKKQAFIIDVSPLISNQFRAKATAGNVIPFSTDLFLESVRNDFIDTIPPTFSWQPGQPDIPIIFSADFLEMYNVFAPAQDLPQLSESSISAVNISLECYGASGVRSFKGHVVAVSDRINSVLVPESFLQWANKSFGNAPDTSPARVFIKTTDANNPSLLSYMEQKNYHVNKDKTKFGRVKQVLRVIVSSIGGFAILVILLAMMLFSFYLQLMVATSRNNLELLITLGYSPKWLSYTVSKRWISGYSAIIFLALILTAFIQYIFKDFSINGKDALSMYPNSAVVVLAIVLLVLCTGVNYRLLKNLLYQLR